MLQVKDASFSYNKNFTLNGINFSIKAGEHLSIIGESGSGKSTLLKLLYGEHDLNSGEIYWNSEQILGPKFNLIAGYEFMKYVSQEFDLEPFISVEENIGVFLSNMYPKKKRLRIKELLEVVELTAFSKIKVRYLSGGQKQRVALARAIAKQPEVLLLDEPFSNIDNFKKQSLRRSLFRHLKENNISCIVATHDKDDVLPYADTMIVLHQGDVLAKDSPQNLYKHPKKALIAAFFGAYNVFKSSELILLNHDANDIIIYANEITITKHSNLVARVFKSHYMGHYYLIEVTFNDRAIFINHPNFINASELIHFAISEELIQNRVL